MKFPQFAVENLLEFHLLSIVITEQYILELISRYASKELHAVSSASVLRYCVYHSNYATSVQLVLFVNYTRLTTIGQVRRANLWSSTESIVHSADYF